MKYRAGLLSVLLGGVARLQAQSMQPPAFEVAAVKVNRSGEQAAGIRAAPGLLTVVNTPLLKIVATAFEITEERETYQLDAPAWARNERYDIVARFPNTTRAGQMRLMLRALLKERFKMSVHPETREISGYALVVARSGIKIKNSAPEAPPGFRRAPGRLMSESTTMALLADKLAQQTGRPVTDATGLRGTFEMTLTWATEESPQESGAEVSLFTALQEQLGLRLQAQKQPTEVIVIDHLEKIPTDN